MRFILSCTILIFLASCSRSVYYVVRHAERDNGAMGTDVPLSEAGRQRAIALRDLLKKERITHIYSTNYIRTKSTAQPLSDAIHVPVEIYVPGDTSFVTRVRKLGKGNFLIIGHSNTVDDLVNRLAGTRVVAGDLSDTEYGDLFIIRRKGKHHNFEKAHFGQ
ncbi:MAG TPA: histidine phosphatase family protein [Flavisolibacter sp.]|nr:histidine phosphatase family protein [Flavisolibacter sp.]